MSYWASFQNALAGQAGEDSSETLELPEFLPKIRTVIGHEVSQLVDGDIGPGFQTVTRGGSDMSRGVAC